MNPEVTIAAAEIGDRDAVIKLLADQLAEHDIRTAPEAMTSAIDGMMADERRGFIAVIKESGVIVGVAYVTFTWTLEHGGKSAWLEELYVVPERRGQGLGAKLLAWAMERARSSGCAAVDLEVDEEHRRAANLYQRSGFRSLGRRRWVRGL